MTTGPRSAWGRCPCGHIWMAHDIAEHDGDGSDLCCVEGCNQNGCPGTTVTSLSPVLCPTDRRRNTAMNLITRIARWRRGYYREPYGGGIDEPPICACGHVRSVHRSPRCGGWARDQWLTFGPLSWSLRCRCQGMP